MSESDSDPLRLRPYHSLRSCCLEYLKVIGSVGAGFCGAGLAAEFGKGYETLLLIPPEMAGFLTAGGVVYSTWSLAEFVAWREKRKKRRASGGQLDP